MPWKKSHYHLKATKLECKIRIWHATSSCKNEKLNAKKINLHSNPINKDNEMAIESVHINGMPVVSGLSLEKNQNVSDFFSPGTKQTVCNNEVSILSGCP